MKLKKVLYWLPTIVLIIFNIIYIPLWKLISKTYLEYTWNTYGYSMPAEANQIMSKITWTVLAVAIILKLIFSAKRCEIGKNMKIVNIILFVVLCFISMIFSGIFSFA